MTRTTHLVSFPDKKLIRHIGTLPIKKTQGLQGRARVVEKYGCVVMEVEDWIDGINHPEWHREKKQIFGPGDEPYVLQAEYKFSVRSGGPTYGS